MLEVHMDSLDSMVEMLFSTLLDRPSICYFSLLPKKKSPKIRVRRHGKCVSLESRQYSVVSLKLGITDKVFAVMWMAVAVADMFSDHDLIVNRYVSVPSEFGSLNCGSFVAGMLEV